MNWKLRSPALALFLRVVHASPLSPSFFHKGIGHDAPMPEFGSPEFYSKLLVSAMLVLLGGAFAGSVSSFAYISSAHRVSFSSLTLGLMGLDDLHLRVLAASSDDPKEKGNAKKGLLLPVECICTPHTLRQSSSSWQRAAIGFWLSVSRPHPSSTSVLTYTVQVLLLGNVVRQDLNNWHIFPI